MAKTKKENSTAEKTAPETTEAVENQVEENAAAPAPATQSNEVTNIIQALGIYNQAVQVGQTKGIFTLEDSEVIAKAKRYGTSYSMKEQLKANFNNGFFTQTEKLNDQGKKVFNYEAVELESSEAGTRDVEVFNIEEQILFFSNDNVFVANPGDTVIRFNGVLFLEIAAITDSSAE